MKEHEPIEIPDHLRKRNASSQALWVKEKLVGHVLKRADDPNVTEDDLIKDICYTARIIEIQAIHLSTALAGQAQNLLNSLKGKGY